jgi:hypothetical protein
LLLAATAWADITVDIISTDPSDGLIHEDGQAIVYWRIESDTSGDYNVEVGGDGTVGSGDQIAASDGEGTFTGTKNGQSTISASADLGNEAGTYTIYVIATAGDQSANASTAIQLAVPPDAITGLSVGRGDKRLLLYWDASTSEELDHYLVYYTQGHGETAGDYGGFDASEGASPIDVGDVTNYQLSGLQNDMLYCVRVSGVNTSGEEGPLSEEQCGAPSKSEGFSQLSHDGGGCFIATAAFGDYDHPLVRNLRDFRDRVLLRSTPGAAFVRAYYRWSPAAARWLAAQPTARAAVRVGLTPIAWVAGAEARHPGAASIPLLLTLSVVLALALWRRREEAR